MDRRQRKTRAAIFAAFTELLSEKNVANITVGEIIERADVGRATFYAHFETKDLLLQAFCRELFDHVFEVSEGRETAHSHLFDCDGEDSVFLHLFRHLARNDHNVLVLLSGRNNELFLQYFRACLTDLIRKQAGVLWGRKAPELPEDFWICHVSATFTQTLDWWIRHGMKESPEVITRYFWLAV